MKDLGYGAGYSYDHDAPDGFSGDNYWPDGMAPADFYRPVDRGVVKRIAARLAWWDERRRAQDLRWGLSEPCSLWFGGVLTLLREVGSEECRDRGREEETRVVGGANLEK